ncbi:MAG: RluA family pseudouridine synthase [Candidatus Azosocius agrarius]|nr:MAG: RluA family pseudouridine synthase [Gammaproteobacteria bacterium]
MNFLDVNIIYEDYYIIVINKFLNMKVHAVVDCDKLTLVNFLLYNYPYLITLPRCGILHRLDKNTTGLLIVSKTFFSYNYLINQFKMKNIMRGYVAIVNGCFITGGNIVAPISKCFGKKMRMIVVKDGVNAITCYRILKKFKNFTFIKLLLKTGKTHQIRVHMQHINHSIIGDFLYAKININDFFDNNLRNILKKVKRQILHANKLIINHPYTNRFMMWDISLSNDFNNLLMDLKLYDIYTNNIYY